MIHLKKPQRSAEEDDRRTREVVEGMIADIERRGEAAVRDYAKKFDDWTGDFLLGAEKKARLIEQVPQQVKDDIGFAYEQVSRFAAARVRRGLRVGQPATPARSLWRAQSGWRW